MKRSAAAWFCLAWIAQTRSENDKPGRSALQLRSTGPTVLESRARNEYGSGLYLAPIPSRPKARLFWHPRSDH